MGKRVDYIIKKMGGKEYPIYRQSKAIDPDSGADIVTMSDEPTLNVLACIQPPKKATQLQNGNDGDLIVADFVMYHSPELEVFDLVLYRSQYYEIRAIEPWESSFMNYFKSYLVKVDNQDET